MTRQRVALLAGLLLGGLALLVPAPADLSPAAQRVAAVTILMSCWWIGEAIPIGATALMPFVAFPLLGVMPALDVARCYGDPVIFLFLGAFMIALAMERWGLHRRIALGMVAAIGDSPRRLVLGFLAATTLLSMWINNTATTLMMFPVGLSVVEHLAAQAQHRGRSGSEAAQAARESLGAALMLGIAYGASIGGMATLVGTAPNLILVGAVQELFPELPPIRFLPWLLLGLPTALLLAAAAYGAVLRCAPAHPLGEFRFGSAAGVALAAERRRAGPMSQGERRVLALFLAAAALWITRAPVTLGGVTIPGWADLFAQPRFLHDGTVAVAVGLLLFLASGRGSAAPAGGRAPLLDWATVQQRVPWGVLLLLGGGFALATAFEASGLSPWIGSRLRGLSGVPLPLVVAAVCLATTLLSEIASNTATATMLMPILGASAAAVGASPFTLMVAGALAASCGFMLPVATPPNAIVFACGWISVTRMARAGFVLDIAGVLVLTALCTWLAPRLLGVAAGG